MKTFSHLETAGLQELVGKTIQGHWMIRNIVDGVVHHNDSTTDWTVERQAIYQYLPDAWLNLRTLIHYMTGQEQDIVLSASSILLSKVDYEGCAAEAVSAEMARQADGGRPDHALIDKHEVLANVQARLQKLRRHSLNQWIKAENQILDVLLRLEARIKASWQQDADNETPTVADPMVAGGVRSGQQLNAGDAEQDPPECVVTIRQAAAMVSRSTRTVRRWVRLKSCPRPRVFGGGGKPHEYAWSELRPFLEKRSGRKLPERFPFERFHPI